MDRIMIVEELHQRSGLAERIIDVSASKIVITGQRKTPAVYNVPSVVQRLQHNELFTSVAVWYHRALLF